MVGGVRYLERAPPRTFAIQDVPLLREAGAGLERSPQLPIVRSGRDSPEPLMHTDGKVIIRKSERAGCRARTRWLYPAQVRTRKSLAEIIRKLSVT
jgi:hypothetical protein